MRRIELIDQQIRQVVRMLVRWCLVEDGQVLQFWQRERAAKRRREKRRTWYGGTVDDDAGEVVAQKRIVRDHGLEVRKVVEGGEDEGQASEWQSFELVAEDAAGLEHSCDAAIQARVLIALDPGGKHAVGVTQGEGSDGSFPGSGADGGRVWVNGGGEGGGSSSNSMGFQSVYKLLAE